jgi:hypothetical protein
MTRTIMAAALALAVTLPAAHAAGRDRVFVASYGNDSNTCTFGSPCKTFQHAVNVVAAGGEVTAIDSAGFGPIAISHAVTITSPAGVEAGIVPVAGGDAIDISAGPYDAIILRGLTLNGSGTGSNGIFFTNGASLTVSDCVVENFVGSGFSTGDGILIAPTSGAINFAVTNTSVTNNGFAGLIYLPTTGSATANGVIDHVVATNNATAGILIQTNYGGGAASVSIANSTASNNGIEGIDLYNDFALSISIDNTTVSGNSIGIYAGNSVQVTLGRSEISNNTTGVQNSTSAFYTYQNNQIDLNGTDVTAVMSTTKPVR